MDGTRFDTLTRRLASARTRRAVLGGLAALFATGGSAGALPPQDYCQPKKGGKCNAHIPCCSGDCNGSGTCGCTAPKVECHDQCVSPGAFKSDIKNCGACGHVCPKGHTCCGGTCCPNSWACLDGACIDFGL